MTSFSSPSAEAVLPHETKSSECSNFRDNNAVYELRLLIKQNSETNTFDISISNVLDICTGRNLFPEVDVVHPCCNRTREKFELPDHRVPNNENLNTPTDVKAARDQLLSEMRVHIDEKRYARFAEMLDGFEKRMTDRAFLQKVGGVDAATADKNVTEQMIGTYNQLAKLIGTDMGPREMFDQQKRVSLAEQFMFHAKDPSTSDQGANGTCWIHAAHAIGMTKNPAEMAKLLTDISLTSEFTTLNSGEKNDKPKTVRFSKGLFSVGARDEESRWSVDNAENNGRRSMLGMIFDQALPVIGGRRENRSNSGTYGEARRIMYMVTGDIIHSQNNLIDGSKQKTLLLDGGYMTWTPTHMRSMQLRRDDDGRGWETVHDNQWGESSDKVVSRTDNIESWRRTYNA